MIKVESFCKAYESQAAVTELSFEVQSGEILGLIGPNGTGKTTTMRAVAGIIPASQGRLSVAGFDIESDSLEVKRRTAYVPDDPQLFNDLTVAQHFSFVASAWNLIDWQERMHAMLEQFDLTGKIDSRAADLSRGMRQKLAFCCACLYHPAALLLDEPMTGLDPRGIRVLKTSIAKRAAAGAAVVVSSHLLAMVEDICSHVLILDGGRKNFYGTIPELRARFSNSKNEPTLEDIFFQAVETGPVDSRIENPCPVVDMPSVESAGIPHFTE